MRRVALLIGVIALFTVPASLAAASGKPTRAPLPSGDNTFDVAAGLACSFEVAAEPVINNEFTTTFPAQANGDVVVLITGRLVERIANVSTGKSITVNISGPEAVVVHPDGSVTLTALGASFLILFPTDLTPGPVFLINSGRYVATFSASGQETLLSQSGTQFNVCAALS